jgi:predicted nucleic acid-binding protein
VIVYLDTSSLLKLYLSDEDGGDDVRQTLAMADSAVTSSIAYTEARAAFARRYRERRLSRRAFDSVRREFDVDWPLYFVVEPSLSLLNEAGELAEHHRLRALDAIHLASFVDIARRNRGRPIDFSSFDARLNRAAASVMRSLKRARASQVGRTRG